MGGGPLPVIIFSVNLCSWPQCTKSEEWETQIPGTLMSAKAFGLIRAAYIFSPLFMISVEFGLGTFSGKITISFIPVFIGLGVFPFVKLL